MEADLRQIGCGDRKRLRRDGKPGLWPLLGRTGCVPPRPGAHSCKSARRLPRALAVPWLGLFGGIKIGGSPAGASQSCASTSSAATTGEPRAAHYRPGLPRANLLISANRMTNSCSRAHHWQELFPAVGSAEGDKQGWARAIALYERGNGPAGAGYQVRVRRGGPRPGRLIAGCF
jgi:hypothetical protein